MRTQDLIAALVADVQAQETPLARALILALVGGAVVSLALFLALIGPRPDFAAASQTLRFDMKFLDAAVWAAPAFALCL